MTLTLRWRAPERRIRLRWRGPSGMARQQERHPLPAIAAVIGPPGPPGPGSAPLRLDAALAATWILPHPLGRVPTVQVFLAGGEAVLTDIAAGPLQITATFPSPQQGFVLIF
ncbi:MAG: hypothetical protein ABIQ81_02085 [Novosphingobium sp.]